MRILCLLACAGIAACRDHYDDGVYYFCTESIAPPSLEAQLRLPSPLTTPIHATIQISGYATEAALMPESTCPAPRTCVTASDGASVCNPVCLERIESDSGVSERYPIQFWLPPVAEIGLGTARSLRNRFRFFLNRQGCTRSRRRLRSHMCEALGRCSLASGQPR